MTTTTNQERDEAMRDLDRKAVELAWARATPLLKEHFGVQGTSTMVTAIIVLLAEPIIAAYLSAAPAKAPTNQEHGEG
jgi:F0F1-type ATP synthase membrane subunit b/b'